MQPGTQMNYESIVSGYLARPDASFRRLVRYCAEEKTELPARKRLSILRDLCFTV